MQRKTVTVANQIGLRSRVATIFIDKAKEFESTVHIRANERSANGKSLLGVLSLGITGGKTIELVVNGSDEEVAIVTLKELIDSGFENY